MPTAEKINLFKTSILHLPKNKNSLCLSHTSYNGWTVMNIRTLSCSHWTINWHWHYLLALSIINFMHNYSMLMYKFCSEKYTCYNNTMTILYSLYHTLSSTELKLNIIWTINDHIIIPSSKIVMTFEEIHDDDDNKLTLRSTAKLNYLPHFTWK